MGLPEPYFADGSVTLYHGDALDLLPLIPAGSVDAVVTDPPYLNTGTATSRVSKSGGIPNERQFFDVWMRGVWRDLASALKPTGALWMTVDWRGALSCEWAAGGSPLSFGGAGVWDRGGLGMGIELVSRAIRLLAPPDDGVILDPFAGSGTTGLAARLEGRRAILIEREERYAEVAARRLERMPRGTETQPSLFAGAGS